MWNESGVLSWPLLFRRQYAQPLDIDSVFETLAEMDAYLSNTIRHVGQIATCQETEGIIYIMNNNRDAWVTVDAGGGSLIFSTTTELNAYLTNDDRLAGGIATCLETEGILYIMNNLRTAWISIDYNSKLNSIEFYSHTGDTSIHYTKNSINISDINSAHTHSITEIPNLQDELNSKLNLSGGTLTGALNALTIIANDYSGITTSMVYNETSLSGETIQDIFEDSNASEATIILLDDLLVGGRIEDIDGVNTQVNKYWTWELLRDDIITNIPSDLTELNAHTGDTSIHFTKDSINIADINSAHTHTITDVTDLQNELNSKTDLVLFNTHTGETNPHLTEFSDLITTAHTHTISDTENLQTELNSKLNLTGGTLTGDLIGTTIIATNYSGITSSMITNISSLSGDTITDVLNATEAVQKTGITNSDILIGQRIGEGNVYWDYQVIKNDTRNGLLSSDVFYTHTGDTSIHFTKDSINISDINSAHTHTISDVINLQEDLNLKTNLTLFSTHTGETNPHLTEFTDLIVTAHTHIIQDIFNLQSELNSKLNLTGGELMGNLTAITYYGDGSHLTGIITGVDVAEYNLHTGDTSIHFTKNSINISDINSAHTHIIDDVTNLQNDLNLKTDLTLFLTHTGDTNPHLTEFSDLIITAHTHTITDTTNLQSTLNNKTDLTLFLTHTGDTNPHLTEFSDLIITAHTHTITDVSNLQLSLNNKTDLSLFNPHTGDTTIHYTKNSINIGDINSAHTHEISDVINLQEDLNLKTNLTLFNTHTGETNPHLTEFSDLITTAHTHTISHISNLQTELNSKLNLTGGTITGNLTAITYYGDGSQLTGIVTGVDVAEYNSHTGDTSIHFTKDSINISDMNSAHTHGISEVLNLQTSLNNKTDLSLFSTHTATTNAHAVSFNNLITTAHTHTISDVTYLQNELNSKTDLLLFNTHTGETNPHLTEFSDLIVTAHTHTISDTSNLQTELNSKLNLTGGELTGNLTAVTYYGDGSKLTGIITGVDIADFNAHTGDTTIHYTKDSINITDINSAHTHNITEVVDLQINLNSKTNSSLFNTHTGETNPHLTEFSDLITTAHTHNITDVSNLQNDLNSKTDLSLFLTHTGQTNPHLTEFSDLIITAHTHTITDTSELQTTLNSKTELSFFNSHTGDTTIHYTKESINISDINSAHTHGISDVSNLQSSLNSKTDLTLFSTHTGTTNPHLTEFSDLIVTAHTHTASEISIIQNGHYISNNQADLNEEIRLDIVSMFNADITLLQLIDTHIDNTDVHFSKDSITIADINSAHTHKASEISVIPDAGFISNNQADLNEEIKTDIINIKLDNNNLLQLIDSHIDTADIHFTKDSITIADINSAHTHTIADVSNLQTSLDLKTNLTLFNSHTGQTNPHLTKFSDLTVTAHTHAISDVSNLQTSLNSKLSLAGGTMTGTLIGTTISASTYQGITASHVMNNSTNVEGNTLKDVLDNATLAIDGLALEDNDLFPIAREVDSGGTFVSTNMYHPWSRIKNEIAVIAGNGIMIFNTTDDLNTYLLNDNRTSGEIATCNENQGVIYILNDLMDAWIPVDIYTKTDLTSFNSHTGDTSIHFTKNSINISDINSAHTHAIADVSNLQTSLNSKTDLTLFNNHTGATNPHLTSFSDLISTAHTHIFDDGFYYRNSNIQGKHTVTTEITNAGFFTVSVLMELNDGDSGTTVLMPQNNGILLHPESISLTYISSLYTETSPVEPEISFTRFESEGETLTLYGYDSPTIGTRTVYRVSDGLGGWSYELNNERAVILANGDWDFQYEAYYTYTSTPVFNTTYYNLVITGHADLFHSIL